ncbi:peptide ABC transporter permease [Bacillus gaemokensis]|nr:peptide ABC transporter permease [Bacillus gaemokensis]
MTVLLDAKKPIFYAVLISFFRTLLSLIFGFVHAYFYRYTKWLEFAFETFQYVPTTLLAIFLLSATNTFAIARETQWALYTITVLTLIGIPNLTQLISNELRLLLQHEFVTSSKTLGGGFFHICKLHLKPYLLPKAFIWLNQQMLQVLVLLMHLALFEAISHNIVETLFFIGPSSKLLPVLPWVAFGPVLLFTIAILALYMMMSGMKHILEKDIDYTANSLLLSILAKEKMEKKKKIRFSHFKQRANSKET